MNDFCKIEGFFCDYEGVSLAVDNIQYCQTLAGMGLDFPGTASTATLTLRLAGWALRRGFSGEAAPIERSFLYLL